MVDAPTREVFDVVTDFFASQPTDEEMLAYEIPAEQQARLDELLEIDSTSRLTAAQREELGDYRFVEDVLARVKVKVNKRQEQGDDEGGDCAGAESDASVDEESDS